VFDDLPTVTVAPVADTVTLDPLDEAELKDVPTVRELVEAEPEPEAVPEPAAEVAPQPPPKAEDPPAGPIAGGSLEPDVDDREDVAKAWLEQLAAEAEGETSAATTEEILAAAAQQAESQMDEDELWDQDEAPAPRVQPPRSPAPPGHLPERRVVVIDDDADIDIRAGQEAPPPPPTDERQQPTNIGATLEEDGGRKRRWRKLFGKGGE
jgi:hypothetical protein